MDLTKIATAIIASAGGLSIIIVGLAAWLGKLWAARIQEAEKARYSRELEMLKSSLELERLRTRRNSEAQFNLYSDIWSGLQELKLVGDAVWDKADEMTLHSFTEALLNARRVVEKGRLVIDVGDYMRLREILHVFGNFRVGKLRLVEIRSHNEFREMYFKDSVERIQDQIDRNREVKDQYDRLLDEIVQRFRRQLELSV